MKKVSIIIPVFNSESYLKECLESVINQSYKALEIIIVNDGSTDSSEDIIKEFIQKDPRFIYIKQKNQGVSVARNKALEVASGDYVYFLDSDDYISLECIANFVSMAVKNDADLVISNYECFYDSGESVKEEIHNKSYEDGLISKESIYGVMTDIFYDKLQVCTVMAGNKLVRTSVAKSNPFKVGITHEDEFAILPLIIKCTKICWLGTVGYYYRLRDKSITHSYNKSHHSLITLEAIMERIEIMKSIHSPYVDKFRDYFFLNFIREYVANFNANREDVENHSTSYKQILKKGLKKNYKDMSLKDRFKYSLFCADLNLIPKLCCKH